MSDRARQFMPFDALKGFREEIQNKEHIVIEKPELSDDYLEELSYKMKQVTIGMILDLVIYRNNEYVQLTGMVSKIDLDNRFITIVKNKIDFDEILDLSSDSIKSF